MFTTLDMKSKVVCFAMHLLVHVFLFMSSILIFVPVFIFNS